MRKLLLLLLLPLLFCCKSKKTQLTDEDEVGVSDFVEFFQEVKLPYQLTDSVLDNSHPDSSLISYKVFTQFVGDTLLQKLFGKANKLRIYPLGRVDSKNDETYLFVRVMGATKRVMYVLVFDKQQKYVAGMPLIAQDNDAATSTIINIDSRYSITSLLQRRKPDGVILYKKNVYIFNADPPAFVLILTESNDNEAVANIVINPIDTVSRKHKFAGDYFQDKKNFISIRDGKNASSIMLFVHFEKDGGTCKGELKGEAVVAGANLLRYNERGGPCQLELNFAGRSVTMKEKGGCGSHRDIKCFFEGTYTRKEAAIPKKKPVKKN